MFQLRHKFSDEFKSEDYCSIKYIMILNCYQSSNEVLPQNVYKQTALGMQKDLFYKIILSDLIKTA